MPSHIFFKDLVKQAWSDTRAEIGLSWGTAIRTFAAFVGTILLYYWFKSEADVMSVWEGGLYSFLIFIALVFLPCFLWNLWLAPYRILAERFNERLNTHKEESSDPPKSADFSDYKNYTDIELYGAACLWVGLEPHYPLRDSKAKAKLGLLKSAIRKKKLSSSWQSSSLKDIYEGVTDRSPTDHQPVSMIALRKYADFIGDVPTFLEHVSVPSIEENKGQSG